ncbi:MAG TPA: hypothetical protein VIN59_06830 [Alphaproteobacteria bacterium]
MYPLSTTMLREKFIIREGDGKAEPMIAVGNRLALPLISKSGKSEERLVVRGQNMHTTLRMAAMITRTFYNDGPILHRSPSYPWGPNWQEWVPDHETENNERNWIAVYSGGRPIFKGGNYHPFLDIIEQCDARNRDEYDRAVSIAEAAFNQAGRGVSIDHHTTIAMVFGGAEDKTRVGLIYRNPQHSSTFNFNVEAPLSNKTRIKAKNADPHKSLMHAAAWLELVQLSVSAGFYKARRADVTANLPPLSTIQGRLGKLNGEIEGFEQNYEVGYRPERPEMLALIDETAHYAQGIKG